MLIILLVIVLFAVGADQLTKALIYGHEMPFIKGFIRFSPVENRGVAWGFLQNTNGATVVISIFTVVVIGLMVFLIIKYRKVIPYAAAVPLACVLGGAIGNLIDRVFIGYVRDFICTEFVKFPVFNVADCFVTCGGIVLAFVVLFTRSGKEFISKVFPEEKQAKKHD